MLEVNFIIESWSRKLHRGHKEAFRREESIKSWSQITKRAHKRDGGEVPQRHGRNLIRPHDSNDSFREREKSTWRWFGKCPSI